MQTMKMLTLTAGALVLGGLTMQSARAADMPIQQGQMQPPPAYAPPPPPVAYYPPPPPVAYYPPPPPAYYVPAYAGWPGPYYGRWAYYWRGYGPRFAYGYGHWGRGWHR